MYLAVLGVLLVIGAIGVYWWHRTDASRARPSSHTAVTEFSSDRLGISFAYPDSYVLSEGSGEGSAAGAYFIALTPHLSAEAESPSGVQIDREPSPGITFAVYRDTDPAKAPDVWIREQMTYRAAEGNFQDPTLHSITVGGLPAVRYIDTSGIYQRDTVLLRHDGRMVQITADDATYFKADLDSILASLQFKTVSAHNGAGDAVPDPILACYSRNTRGTADEPKPNNSIQHVKETERTFINMPKNVYPKDILHSWTTATGTATAGYISNAGLPGEAEGVLPGCWSTYIGFDGSGEVDLRVKSTVNGVPDYFVRFIVSPV
jgi:hypothetical protein